jgi:hypothetical protein
MIEEYSILDIGECHICHTHEDITVDEDGDEICTDCLFEKKCEEL